MENTVSLVYGGMGGIGQALVVEILGRGSKVMCCDVTSNDDVMVTWHKAHGDNSVSFSQCDVRKTEDVKGAFTSCQKVFGRLPSLVVNLVGILDELDWENCVDTNLKGTIRVIEATLETIGKDKGGEGGTLILVSSVVGVDKGANIPVYTATKHGIVGLARSWADPLHYNDHGIRISCVCPSGVNTPLMEYSLKRMHKSEILEGFLQQVGGYDAFQSPESVAEVMMKVAEDETSNGKVYAVTKTNGTQEVEFPAQPFL